MSSSPTPPNRSDLWWGLWLVSAAILGSALLSGCVMTLIGLPQAWIYPAWATVACLVPGWLVFWVQSLYGSDRSAVPLALGGAFLRMLSALAAVAAAMAWQPGVQREPLVAAVAVTYFAALASETWMLVKKLPKAAWSALLRA